MIELKIEGLLCEIDSQYVPSKPPSVPRSIAAGTTACEATTAYPATACESVLEPVLATASGTIDSPIVLDHISDLASEVVSDACPNVADRAFDTCANSAEWKRKKSLRVKGGLEGAHESRCEGIFMGFPQGKNHHISYPFGLHSERNVPWDYCSTKDKFYVQAKLCHKPLISKGSACEDCQALTSIPLYVNIMDRIRHGVHKNAPLVYHGIGGLVKVAWRKIGQVRQLRLTKLNTSRKLLGKATTLDDHKQWIMAIASGRVD
ncbi:hypothetical protein EDB84DRAFT_1557011 [Lactarius hengduanensis]|nr:hypothetical protein EDB84DRAFT_1557011 [Lactarius hengduanensis]